MRSAYNHISNNSPMKFDIPITKCTEIQPRMDNETWSDVKKGIRDKVYSRVQGFENQKFIQKSDLLYNFKNTDEQQQNLSSLRSSTAFIKNHVDNKFPRQESPIRMGLTNIIYSPSQKIKNPIDDLKPPLGKYDNNTKQQQIRISNTSKSSSDIIDLYRKNKPIQERVTLSDIIKISTHLSDLQQNDIQSLSNGYLSELVGLQNNINRLLKYSKSHIK